MAGLRGQVREPQGGARARRNSQNLASTVSFIGPGSVIVIDGDGFLQLTVGDGLENNAGTLQIDLAGTASGLAFSSGDLIINLRDTEPGLELAATGLGLLLATDPGLEFSTGVRVKLNGNTLARAAAGMSVVTANLAAAGAVDKGVVNRAAAVADLNQTIGAVPTQAEVQAISDKVDELLASLRTAGILAP